MKTILLISGLLLAAPLSAQVAPNPATNGGPNGMPTTAMPATDATAPMPDAAAAAGTNPATNGPGTTMPAPADTAAPSEMPATAKVPMCSRTVTDKCMQSGARHMRKHK